GRCAFLGVGFFAVLAAFSQAEDKPAARQPASEGHRFLDQLSGHWDVATTFRLGGQEHHGSARCEAQWVLDGHALRQEYQSCMNGRPFTVLKFLGYDPVKKKFWEIKMDSMDPGVMHNEGTSSPDGKSMSMTGTRTD